LWRRFVSRRHSRRFSPRATTGVDAAFSDGFVGVRVALFRVVNGRIFRSEIPMGWTGTCHPEWGYLAASRRSTWKMRLFIFAAAVGASATGAACCSIVYRPLAAEVLVAERTLTPADRTAGPEKATETSQANVRTDASMQGPSLTSAASTAPLGPVWRAPIKRAQAVVPTAPRYGSYAAGYQPWYSARQRGSYGLQSKYGSYTNRQYQ